MREQNRSWKVLLASVAVVFFVGLSFVFGVVIARHVPTPVRWVLMLVTMILFLVAVGHAVSGRPWGILIDPRYKMSLSRLQMTLWTAIVFSAYLTVALPRSVPGWLWEIETREQVTREQVTACADYLADQESEEAKEAADGLKLILYERGHAEFEEASGDKRRELTEEEFEKVAKACMPSKPLNIAFPEELLLALGISTASLAGSSLIKKVQGLKPVTQKELTEAETIVTRVEREYQERHDNFSEARADEAESESEVKRLERRLAQATSETDKNALQEKLRNAKRDYEEARRAHETALKELRRKTEVKNEAEENCTALREAYLKGTSLHKNDGPEDAVVMDMFRYEKAGMHKSVDLGKVQVFFLTIVVLFSYAAALWGLLSQQFVVMNPQGVDLPAFSRSLNVLLVLTHGGYLAHKATG